MTINISQVLSVNCSRGKGEAETSGIGCYRYGKCWIRLSVSTSRSISDVVL